MARTLTKVLTDTLAQLGLNEQETQVYQVALALGSRPASVIAQKSGLKRGHTYNVLQRLMDKGLVQEFVKANVRHFVCSPPQALLSIARAREEELQRTKERLEEIIPELEKIRSPLLSQPKVRFFPGVEGMKEVYEDMLRTSSPVIYGFLDFDFSWSSLTPYGREFAQNFVRRREESGIEWKGLVVKTRSLHSTLDERPAKHRSMRVVTGVQFPAEIQVYGPKVAFFSTKDEYIGVVIENEPIAETLREIFDYMWKFTSDELPVPEKDAKDSHDAEGKE